MYSSPGVKHSHFRSRPIAVMKIWPWALLAVIAKHPQTESWRRLKRGTNRSSSPGLHDVRDRTILFSLLLPVSIYKYKTLLVTGSTKYQDSLTRSFLDRGFWKCFTTCPHLKISIWLGSSTRYLQQYWEVQQNSCVCRLLLRLVYQLLKIVAVFQKSLIQYHHWDIDRTRFWLWKWHIAQTSLHCKTLIKDWKIASLLWRLDPE